MSYNYPKDEFDNVPEGYRSSRANHRRQSVHSQEHTPTKKGGLGWLIGAGILALLLGVAAFAILPRLMGDGGGSSNDNTVASTASESASSNGDVQAGGSNSSSSSSDASSNVSAGSSPSSSSDSQDGSENGNNPSASQSSSSGSDKPASSSSSGSNSGKVDQSTPIPVYNATPTNGLAATASGRLSSGGFVPGSAENWQGAAIPTSVVYYKDDNQKATAEAAGKALGITNVQK